MPYSIELSALKRAMIEGYGTSRKFDSLWLAVLKTETLNEKKPARLMIRRAISYLLITLIALQSVVAMADAHRLHQTGTEHLEFEHSHQPGDTESDKQLSKQASEKSGQPLYDCHHCCHCHGHGSMVLAVAASQLTALFSGHQKVPYRANLTMGIPPTLFRPPIA